MTVLSLGGYHGSDMLFKEVKPLHTRKAISLPVDFSYYLRMFLPCPTGKDGVSRSRSWTFPWGYDLLSQSLSCL